jgi:hypothetical protein
MLMSSRVVWVVGSMRSGGSARTCVSKYMKQVQHHRTRAEMSQQLKNV